MGDEIFELVKKKDIQRRIRLIEKEYGYEPVQTEIFVRRIPFYFYQPDFDKGQHGSLADLVYGLISEDSQYKDWERLYCVLERMFYHQEINIAVDGPIRALLNHMRYKIVRLEKCFALKRAILLC